MKLSIAFIPQIDGQTENTIKTLEVMLRACVFDFTNSLDDHLPLIQFSYNNMYHSRIWMEPFDAAMVGDLGHQFGGSVVRGWRVIHLGYRYNS